MYQKHNENLGFSKKSDFLPSRSDGVYFYSKDGRKVLDFSNNFGLNSFTNNFNIIEKSIINQLHHGFLFQSSEFCSDVAQKLEGNLCKLAGFNENCNKDDDKKKSRALFFNSISEANEYAVKIARNRYNKLCDRNYNEIIFFNGADHGNSIAMLSATNDNINFEPRLSGFKHAIINDITSVEKQINEHTCAVMLETIQYSNGIIACDKDFLQKLKKLCTKHEIMLILDETRCGCCRSGTFFAYEQYGILPDAVTLSSGFCGGFPLSCCIVNDEMVKFIKDFDEIKNNNVIGNELFYSVANNIINEMSDQNFLNNIIKMSKLFKTNLEELAEKYKNVIKFVNTSGLMISIKIEDSVKNYRLAEFFLSNGLMTKVANNNILLFFPPLNIGEKQIKEATDIISTSIEEIQIIERY